MVTIHPLKPSQQRSTPIKSSSSVSSSLSSSSSEFRSRKSVSSRDTTASSRSSISHQQKPSLHVASTTKVKQADSNRSQQGKPAAPSSRRDQTQKSPSLQTRRDARPSPSSKSNHPTEDVKPNPSKNTAAFVESATRPADERLDLFGILRVEFGHCMDIAERELGELMQQNKDLQAQNLRFQEEKEHAIAKETEERSRNEDLEKELSNTKEDKQRALNELKQERDTTATLLKNQKQTHELLIAMIRQNSCARRRLKKSKRNMQSALKELNQKAETTTQLQSMVAGITKTCEAYEVKFKRLQDNATTENRERREADNAHFRLLNECREAETEYGDLREDLESSQKEIDSLKEEKLSQEKSSKEQKRKFEKDLTEYLSMIQSRDDEISTLKSENETLSKEKQDLTARNIFLQRKVHRASVQLRTTQRLLTNERANSMKSRKQKKAMCTALDKAKEEQTRLTIAKRDLEALIPTLQNDIEDLKDWVTALLSALLDAEQQRSTSQDSPGVTARPNNPRTRERKRNRQVGQIRVGGRTYVGEWWSQVEANTILEIWSKQSLGHKYGRKNGRKGKWRR